MATPLYSDPTVVLVHPTTRKAFDSTDPLPVGGSSLDLIAAALGTPQDTSADSTVIGLLKLIAENTTPA